jgi:hypothetical protein
VRIHPEDLTVHPVGKIPPSGWVRFLFVGPDLYFTGAPHLRRVRNVVPQ